MDVRDAMDDIWVCRSRGTVLERLSPVSRRWCRRVGINLNPWGRYMLLGMDIHTLTHTRMVDMATLTAIATVTATAIHSLDL